MVVERICNLRYKTEARYRLTEPQKKGNTMKHHRKLMALKQETMSLVFSLAKCLRTMIRQDVQVYSNLRILVQSLGKEKVSIDL